MSIFLQLFPWALELVLESERSNINVAWTHSEPDGYWNKDRAELTANE